MASVSLATVVSFILPSVKNTLYFHRDGIDDDSLAGVGQSHHGRVNPISRIKTDFLMAFRSPYVLKWSLWWALAMCGNFQVGNYIQPLWETIQPSTSDNVNIYNGAVEATTTLVGAILAFAFGYLPTYHVIPTILKLL